MPWCKSTCKDFQIPHIIFSFPGAHTPISGLLNGLIEATFVHPLSCQQLLLVIFHFILHTMAFGTSPTCTEPRLSIISGPSQPALLNWTFNDLLRDRLLHHHDNVAIISQHQNETLTYADLNQRAEKFAAALYGLGVKKDDRVGVLLGNRVEYAIVSVHHICDFAC